MRLRYQEGGAKIEWLTGHALNPGRGKSIIRKHQRLTASSNGGRVIRLLGLVHSPRKT